MNLTAFHAECVQKKEALKLSSKDIAAMAMASQATVSRFFQNGGEGISYSILCAIGEALGVETPIKKNPLPDTGCATANLYVQKVEDLYKERLQKHAKIYERLLENKDTQLKSREEELKKSEKSRYAHLIINIVTVAVFIIMLFIDLSTPLIGWIRW